MKMQPVTMQLSLWRRGLHFFGAFSLALRRAGEPWILILAAEAVLAAAPVLLHQAGAVGCGEEGNRLWRSGDSRHRLCRLYLRDWRLRSDRGKTGWRLLFQAGTIFSGSGLFPA